MALRRLLQCKSRGEELVSSIAASTSTSYQRASFAKKAPGAEDKEQDSKVQQLLKVCLLKDAILRLCYPLRNPLGASHAFYRQHSHCSRLYLLCMQLKCATLGKALSPCIVNQANHSNHWAAKALLFFLPSQSW